MFTKEHFAAECIKREMTNKQVEWCYSFVTKYIDKLEDELAEYKAKECLDKKFKKERKWQNITMKNLLRLLKK